MALTKIAVPSQAYVVSGNTEPFASERAALQVGVEVTAVSGSTPTLVVEIEYSSDRVNWHSAVTSGAHKFSTFSGTGHGFKVFDVQAAFWRVKWTVAGGTPSFTFTVVVVQMDSITTSQLQLFESGGNFYATCGGRAAFGRMQMFVELHDANGVPVPVNSAGLKVSASVDSNDFLNGSFTHTDGTISNIIQSGGGGVILRLVSLTLSNTNASTDARFILYSNTTVLHDGFFVPAASTIHMNFGDEGFTLDSQEDIRGALAASVTDVRSFAVARKD